MKFIKIAAVIIALGFSGLSHAAHITVFNSILTGQAANAGDGTGSLGTGAATMTFNSDTMEFIWLVAWQALQGDVTVAHFHGPAGPDQNAGVEVGIDPSTNPTSGSAILSAQQADDLFAGLWYINIHSTEFPGGEIRGQVLGVAPVPLPAAVWLLGSGTLGLIGMGMRRRG